MNWSERILDFPVRAAAVDDFLRELRAHGKGDLNAVLTTLNEGGLCREAVGRWTDSGWIVLAPNQPTVALAGPAFVPQIGLREFCGEAPEADPREPEMPLEKDPGAQTPGEHRIREESRDDEHP